MNMTELTSRVTSALGGKASPASTLSKAADIARQALQEGEAVDLLGLVRLRLTAEGLSGKAKEASAVHAEPLPGVLPGSQMGIKDDTVVIIAVEKTDRFSEILAQRLACNGRRALVAEGLTGVMDAVKQHGADVVIMDSNIENGDEIRLWLKTTPERSLISLIAIYAQSDDPDDVKNFHVCEDEFLVEPYEMQGLEQIIAGEITRIGMERKYFRHEVSFQFPVGAVYQQQAADFMEKLAAHSGLNEAGQTGIVVAFREAVDNASRHGNKGCDRAIISVAYVLDREKVTVTVEDEGAGFDTSMYLETRVSGNAVEVARARHAEGRQGGLGIMLMLKSVDKMEYNREGNVIKLTKFLAK
ncbi:MAG: ATP-binding protein [Planctomycetes bacterium]|nr:ATP-binding protein [Planctomycetota bacterium]